MHTLPSTIAARIHSLRGAALGALAVLTLASGTLVAAAPAAAAPTEQSITDRLSNRDRSWGDAYRPALPAYSDLWTRTYTTHFELDNSLGPLPEDRGCNADARARGYAYGQSYLKDWRVGYLTKGGEVFYWFRNAVEVTITCRAYRDPASAPVLH